MWGGQGAQELGRVEDLAGGGGTGRPGPSREDPVDGLDDEGRGDGVLAASTVM